MRDEFESELDAGQPEDFFPGENELKKGRESKG